jgi:adenylosuccinate synthase
MQEQTQQLKITVPHFADKQQDVVFEGAQGLALDEHLGTFPYVTRSITGLPYALLAAHELGTKTIKPVYVTRCYATRHGRGPLPYEGQYFGATVHDSTNIENPWQEALRFAPLHIPELYARIRADLARGANVAQALGITLQPPALAVTCLDQVDKLLTVCTGKDTFEVLDAAELPEFLTYITGFSVTHASFGSSAAAVKYTP